MYASHTIPAILSDNSKKECIKQFCTHAIVLDHGQLVLDTDNVDEAIALYLGDDA